MKKYCLLLAAFFLINTSLFAFDEGFVLGLKSHFLGSATDPYVNESDMALMGASYMEGNVGFIIQGGMDVSYIFDSKRYFGLKGTTVFGGLGLGGYIEIGEGYSGQVSGKEGVGDVYVNVFFTPVVHLGTTLKAYFLSNKLVIGLGVGARLIADATPMYDMYSSVPTVIPSEVGTIIVTEKMRQQMNPWGGEIKISMEYIQPVLDTTEFVIGGYVSYCFYKPGYISMPPSLAAAAALQNPPFYPEDQKLDSFFLNNSDFGVTLGINFKMDA